MSLKLYPRPWWMPVVFLLLCPNVVHAYWSDGIYGFTPTGAQSADVSYFMPIDDGTGTSEFDRTGCSAGIRQDGTLGGNSLYTYLHYYVTDDQTHTGIVTESGYVVSFPLPVGVASSTYEWTFEGLPGPAFIDGSGMICTTPEDPPYQWPFQQATMIQNVELMETTIANDIFSNFDEAAGAGGANVYRLGSGASRSTRWTWDSATAGEFCAVRFMAGLYPGSTGNTFSSLFTVSVNSTPVASSTITQAPFTGEYPTFEQIEMELNQCVTLQNGDLVDFGWDNANSGSGFPRGMLMKKTTDTTSGTWWDINVQTSTESEQVDQMMFELGPVGGGGAQASNYLGQQTFDGPIFLLDPDMATTTSFFTDTYGSEGLCDTLMATSSFLGITYSYPTGSGISDCVTDIFRYLFFPSGAALMEFKQSAEFLGSRSPFGYASQVASGTRAIFDEQASSSTTVTLQIPPRAYTSSTTTTMPLFDTAEWQENAEPLIAPIRLVLAVLLWMAFGFALYEWAVHHAKT